jgi:hypothetical protein
MKGNDEMRIKQLARSGWQRAFAGPALSVALLLGGCQAVAATRPAEPAAIPTITITAKDHSFELPQQVEAGLVTIEFENQGQEVHHAQLLQLNDGVTVEQFGAALQEGPEAALALVTLAGGPGPVEPGGEQRVTVELAPGLHVLICVVLGPDGVPHVAKGMMAQLQVVEGEAASVQAPAVDAEVTLLDFSFTLPQQIRAGEQTWKITDKGQQPHELALVKLAEGKTAADVQEWMHQPEGAPPFLSAGGMQAIDPGETAYLYLDLTPGNYIAFCYLPDPASGQEHAALGMVMPFTVE